MDLTLHRRKQGQIFTLLAIALILLLFVSVEIYSYIQEKKTIRERVETMDAFLQSIEKNFQRQIYISGYRIIFLAEVENIANGFYVADLDDFFAQAFFNGTINGNQNNLMIGASYPDLVEAIREKAVKINANITLENTTISVSQEDPWYVKFVVSSDLVMTDLQGLAEWKREQNVTAYIPVEEFEDPIYVINTNGLSKKIRKTPYDEHYNDDGLRTNLSLHFSGNFYANHSDAPSFLMRLAGNLSSDPQGNGIESFVDVQELDSQGIPVDWTKSVVDHIYFDSTNPTPGNTVSNMPAYFKIDVGHEARYQI